MAENERPEPEEPKEEEGARREGALRRKIALGIYVLVSAVCFFTVAPERLKTHTPANHFALLAECWLNGRLDMGGAPPAYTGNNDFALHDGKFFVSFPPFPAVLMVPFVKLAGSAERLKDGQVMLWFAGVAPAVLFLALEKLRRGGRNERTMFENAGLAAVFALGSVYWFSAVQGTVWFAAHVIGAGLACLYLWASIDAEHPLLAGVCLGLGFATRTPLGLAFPIFVFEAYRAAKGRGGADWKRRLGGDLVRFAGPAAAVLALLAWHNRARFGDAFEFGHRYLAIVWRARIDKWGLFSFHYLGKNLGVMLTSLPYTGTVGAPFQINAHGLALWVTTPMYAWALWPKRTSPTFWALAATAGLVALPSLLYQNTGWVQFGYRFSNDFAPFLFVMIALGGRRLGWAFRALCAWAVVVNGFGALTFDREAGRRFYFVDGSQRILHQLD
ncbi:MAG: hypothetical protein R3B70_08130 [Polyangiaceae bacterium]